MQLTPARLDAESKRTSARCCTPPKRAKLGSEQEAQHATEARVTEALHAAEAPVVEALHAAEAPVAGALHAAEAPVAVKPGTPLKCVLPQRVKLCALLMKSTQPPTETEDLEACVAATVEVEQREAQSATGSATVQRLHPAPSTQVHEAVHGPTVRAEAETCTAGACTNSTAHELTHHISGDRHTLHESVKMPQALSLDVEARILRGIVHVLVCGPGEKLLRRLGRSADIPHTPRRRSSPAEAHAVCIMPSRSTRSLRAVDQGHASAKECHIKEDEA